MVSFVLEILDGDRAGEVVALGARALRIGRKSGNDLVLADEKTSGVHAEVVPEGDRFVLRDLGSTNGTLLDGRKVTEVVLGPGDTFQIGRVRLRVRAEDGAAVATEDGLTLNRLDTRRLETATRSRSVWLLLVLLLVAGGAGGYLFFFRGGEHSLGTAGGPGGPKPPVQVAGNRLAPAVAGCDAEAGWDLRRAGAGFQPGAHVHTGTGAFEAIAGDTPGFAVAATTEPLVVVPGRTLRVQAQLRTGGGARACVRLYFSGGSDSSPFVFRGGAPLQAHDAWEAAAAEVTVPPLVERCQVEVVAIWPAGGSASFDDVAVVEAGAGAPLERRIEEAAATVVGNAHAVAIRSMDPDLATLLAVLPAQAPADSGPLQAAGLCCLSDLGLQVQVEVDERSCTLALAGGEALALEFPADSSNGLLVGGDGADGGFAGAAATGEFTARQLLLGVERATRCMVELAQPGVVRAQLGGGHYRLELPAAGVKLVLGFRSERNAAGELLRRAQHEPQPGRALDTLRELLRTVPHDLETLAQASALRSELQTALQTELARIAANLDEASFFRTRGAFERAVAQLAALRERYGEQNLPDPQAVATLQETATTGLRAIEQQQAERKRERLEAMATAFTDAQQQGLADLVRDYVRRHLGGRE